ncbi:uncharacterized protein METZ01_LOCUS243552 [marine metagenome]|uniref:phosphoribosylanthranilate isomerase n=1 Tax=marine metagenome TaxID=408172 RepID=A0A382HTR7_9ZZZZ
MLGVVLAPSRRRVTLDQATAVLAEAGPSVLKVGVFVDPDLPEVQEAIAALSLDIVQLQGAETPEFCRSLSVPVLKSFKATAHGVLPDPGPYPAGPIHLDSPSTIGGSGIKWDYSLARDIASSRQVMLSGGLDPENVYSAIEVVKPWAVDVSSGVERDGNKDPARISSFVARVREAHL